MTNNQNKWPELPYEKWKDTLDTLHMWMQIAGKVKLALSPFINQWWQVAFYVTSSGMRTGLIPNKEDAFEISFDFIHHNLHIHKTDDNNKTLMLKPQTVSEFYDIFMNALHDLNIQVTINTMPVEFSDPIAFEKDNFHSSYDKEFVYNWWQLQVRLTIIFEHFRTKFRGKSSPVQFFWGSFDLNSTRFSGKSAIPPDYGGIIMRFAENEENFAFGFWPGDVRYPSPAFYSYIYPAPKGIDKSWIKPEEAVFDTTLNEFILPYDIVRNSSSPEKIILDFLQSTYIESCRLADWDVKSFEGPIPE